MTHNLNSLPLVSIIVPVYNGERYLRESLDFILAQTYRNTEVLVMDDASTDSTPDIIASYGQKVRCFRQQQNRGIYGNMNDGIATARGEYIAIYPVWFERPFTGMPGLIARRSSVTPRIWRCTPLARKYSVGILDEYLLRYRHGHGSSAQRYHHLRTDPERYFRIMDLYLEDGGRELAAPDALAAYEAHRAEDNVMRAINHYILGYREESREVITQMRLTKLLGSPQIQRIRLSLLFLAMQGLVQVPRIPLVANLFYWRWHAKVEKMRPFIWSLLKPAGGL